MLLSKPSLFSSRSVLAAFASFGMAAYFGIAPARALDLAVCETSNGSAYLVTVPDGAKAGWQSDLGSNAVTLQLNGGQYDIRSIQSNGQQRYASKVGKVAVVNKTKTSIMLSVVTPYSVENWMFLLLPTGESKYVLTRSTNRPDVAGGGVYFGQCRSFMLR
jgi:hypothetical protein